MKTAVPLAVLISTASLLVAVGGTLRAEGSPAPRAEARSQPSPTPAPAPVARAEATYTFQVVLVLADNTAAPSAETLPPKAQKALEDVRDFLPYKSYRLIDMAWLRTSRGAQAQLNGPKGETYRLDLSVDAGREEQLAVRHFQLSEMGMLPPPGASQGSSPEVRKLRVLLETTFGMYLGETVVVGTAKLDGPGKALVVMLSAVP